MNENLVTNMFLTPKDLRIGNYINYENTTHVVTELHDKKLIHHWLNHPNEGYVTTYNLILSIPITVNEINKFGFNEDFDRVIGVDGYYDDRGYCIQFDGTMIWLSKYNDNGGVLQITTFDFVHELQNIYFDLTKRELKY